jgi:hypothetical protein
MTRPEQENRAAQQPAPALPAYWLTLPAVDHDEATIAEFDKVLSSALAAGPGNPIPYSLGAPKWEFLHYAVTRGDLVLHGSADPEIQVFEPRKADDLREFGNQAAVYAASDGIWPIFFAIIDRSYSAFLLNASIRILELPGATAWFFSITQSALDNQPWCDGTVYVLPRSGFVDDDVLELGGLHIQPSQVASSSPVHPLAKLQVTPADFPFLQQVRGHDDEVVQLRAAKNPGGFPWV